MPLASIGTLNHVSFVVADVARTVDFYRDVLGFASVQRPKSLDFEGAWLHRDGLSIHLIESARPAGSVPLPLHPKRNHLSFVSRDLKGVKASLTSMGVQYVEQDLMENDVALNQIFLQDPDYNMIEICNCDDFPILPLDEPTTPSSASTNSVFAGASTPPSHDRHMPASAQLSCPPEGARLPLLSLSSCASGDSLALSMTSVETGVDVADATSSPRSHRVV